MKISFDGLRKNIAEDFNALIETIKSSPSADLCEDIGDLRASVGALLCCYDQLQMPDDFNDLSEEIKLLEL